MSRITRIVIFFLVCVICICVLGFVYLLGTYHGMDEYSGRDTMRPYSASFHGCNIAYIKMQGEMRTYGTDGSMHIDTNDSRIASAEDVTAHIRAAAASNAIKAIILEVDSPGGDPVAGEEVQSALINALKPTRALIRSQGDSAGYMAAIGADKIYASPFSDVGSIGVTASYLDTSKQNIRDGLTFHELSTGKYKDTLNPSKELTVDEKKLIMTQLQQWYDRFIDMVAQRRAIPRQTVLALADGSSMTGFQALQHHLIDAFGSIDVVRADLTKLLGVEAVICGIDTRF